MANLTTDLKEISLIIKKEVYILRANGHIICSSDRSKADSIIRDFSHETSMALDYDKKYYIYVQDGSLEEIGLARLVLKDKIAEGTAGDCQQFLINILDGIGPSKEQSMEFGIPSDGDFTVYCVRLPSIESLSDSYSLICNSFYDYRDMWVFPYKSEVVLLQRTDSPADNIRSNGATIREMLNSEIYIDAYIGIGSTHAGLEGIKKPYEEALQAIDIGRIYNIPGHIYVYKDLILERVIKQIPQDKIEEIFRELVTEDIDKILMDNEMVRTIEVLFQNNLNISDSSKALYIHRNTLLYRLDKIGKAAGLDIKRFEDAVILKLILLLVKRRNM